MKSLTDKINSLSNVRREAINRKFNAILKGDSPIPTLSENGRRILSGLYEESPEVHRDYLALVYLHDVGLITDAEYIKNCELVPYEKPKE